LSPRRRQRKSRLARNGGNRGLHKEALRVRSERLSRNIAAMTVAGRCSPRQPTGL
jgi:hypothetical protein